MSVTKEDFLYLFEIGGLRTTEVAIFIGLHRVTVSKLKGKGVYRCDKAIQARIGKLVDIVKTAVKNGELPLSNREVIGKKQRLQAMRTIIKKHLK